MTRMNKVGEWVRTDDHEHELRALFLELEAVLREMNLLRADYKQYRTLHFAKFCADVYRFTNTNG
jgi:hypothetical protein